MQIITRNKRELSIRHKAAIDYALEQLRASLLCPYIKDVLLYGSCARKEQRWESDVDLFIILKETAQNKDCCHREIIRLKSAVTNPSPHTVDADAKFVIGDEWENNRGLYYQNIKKEGISIWHC